MKKSICEQCFHYEACKEIDLTGAVGNPERDIVNMFCYHFINRDRVKIQDKAHWVGKTRKYRDGDVHITYYCSHCNRMETVKCYKSKEWDDYYCQHYRDSVELPNFCKECGSVVEDIVEVEES